MFEAKLIEAVAYDEKALKAVREMLDQDDADGRTAEERWGESPGAQAGMAAMMGGMPSLPPDMVPDPITDLTPPEGSS